MRVRPLTIADAPACDALIAALPEWFGDATGIRDCAEAVRTQPGFAADIDDELAGFLTVTHPRRGTAEISWMAVHPARRHAGVGRALIDALVAQLHAQDTRFLAVKTLSDRVAYEPYAQTRAFYEAMGFTPLMELDIWGPDNPALLYVRPATSVPGRTLGASEPTVEDLLVAARSGGRRVTPEEAHAELLAGHAVLLDQRTLEQRMQHGDIPGAVRISMTVLPWRADPQSPWKLPQIADHDTRVLVVCQEGYSSSLSAAWLRDLGMQHVADVEGGFEAWRDADLPVEPCTA